MTSQMITKTKAQATGFRKLRAARSARMYCRRYPLLLEAAAAYRTAGDSIVAESLTTLAEIKNYSDFIQAANVA